MWVNLVRINWCSIKDPYIQYEFTTTGYSKHMSKLFTNMLISKIPLTIPLTRRCFKTNCF